MVSKKIQNHVGSILIDYLFTMLIIGMMLPIVVSSLSLLMQCLKQPPIVQDMIASYQMRRILALSYDPFIEDNTLYFTYRTTQMRLSKVNKNIIIQPGTQIMYTNVDACTFYEDEHGIWIIYERDNEKTKEMLTKK